MREGEKKVVGHVPVLASVVRELLPVRSDGVVVDATIGFGGHARLFADQLGPSGLLVGLDVDTLSLERSRDALAGLSCRIELAQANFAELPNLLASLGVGRVDVLLADLGVNSAQLDNPERGFSFQHDGPLDMRVDPRLKTTAADIVNRMSEKDLGDLIFFNSQEPGARRIARAICTSRRDARVTTTGRLASIVAGALKIDPDSRKAKVHPATRTFMALRMAVNDELRNLDSLLSAAPDVLSPGGRFGVIAFHSVEDKPVKLDFRRRKNERIYRIVTKKPITADSEERDLNPRSRSAKLRVVERIVGTEPLEPDTEDFDDE